MTADAQTYPFHEAAFDVVTSRFGVMFFDDQTQRSPTSGEPSGPVDD